MISRGWHAAPRGHLCLDLAADRSIRTVATPAASNRSTMAAAGKPWQSGKAAAAGMCPASRCSCTGRTPLVRYTRVMVVQESAAVPPTQSMGCTRVDATEPP